MSSNIPNELMYTEEHEWTKIEGDIAYIGITDFAQSSLGDIVFLEVPAENTKITKGNTFGVVESIKSVSDLYAPLTGTVIESNHDLADSPEQLNSDPYGNWLIKLKIENKSEVDSLMSADQYAQHCDS